MVQRKIVHEAISSEGFHAIENFLKGSPDLAPFVANLITKYRRLRGKDAGTLAV